MTGARWIWLVLCLGACRPEPAAEVVPDRPRPGSTERLLERLALLATQHVPGAGELARTARAVDADPGELAPYVDGLLHDRRFTSNVASSMFVVYGNQHPTGYVLQNTRSPDGELLYYLRRPCAPEDAETVQPWWAPTTTVHVCPDSHRPTYLLRPGTDWHCGSVKLNLDASQDCGCGPHLANCFRDPAHREAVRASLRRENIQTVGWIVDHDLPIETLFTSNATFRDYTAELVYTSWRLLNGEAVTYPDPADWPRDGKWAARPESRPGMHAGILTTPQTLLSADATRTLLKLLYELLWCKAPASSHVDAQTIWSLGVTDLRYGSGWQRLAAMPVCTSCHARLDHGAQLFSGYLGTQRADRYIPALQQSGEEPVYGDDIDDPRGQAERSPLGFARFATAQDEFGACMVEDVARGVFGGPPSPEDEQVLREAFGRAHSIRDVMRAALLREAARWQRGHRETSGDPVPRWPSRASVADERGDLPLSPSLRGELERSCADCHADGPRAFTAKPALDRPLLARMLRAVAFADMPRPPAVLPPARRRALVRELIAMLYPDERSRSAAQRVFESSTRWRAPIPEAARLAAVHAHAGVPEAARPGLDFAYDETRHPVQVRGPSGAPLSPMIALDLAAAGLAACAQVGDPDRGACLDRALRMDAFLTEDAE